jgi:hypothetical protein
VSQSIGLTASSAATGVVVSGGAQWLGWSDSVWLGSGMPVQGHFPQGATVLRTSELCAYGGTLYAAGDAVTSAQTGFVFAATDAATPLSGFGDESLGTGFALVTDVVRPRAIAAGADGVYVAGCADSGCTAPALVRLRSAP